MGGDKIVLLDGAGANGGGAATVGNEGDAEHYCSTS